MDYGSLLNTVVFYGMLFGLPTLSVAIYLVLFVHHSDRLHAQFIELKEAASRQQGRMQSANRRNQYSDPLFRFRAATAIALPANRAEPTLAAEKEDRIANAVNAGRFVLHDTALDQLGTGMVLGKTLTLSDGTVLEAGMPLDGAAIEKLKLSANLSVPILFNPQQ